MTTRNVKNIHMSAVVFVFLVIAALAVFIVVPSAAPMRVSASSVDVFGPACGSATIDGKIYGAEWSGASAKTFTMVRGAGGDGFTVTMRVMNSKRNLYLGMAINDDEFSTYGEFLPLGDGFVFIFDDDLSGSVIELNNNVLSLAAGFPQFGDGYIYDTQVGSSQADVLGGGWAAGSGAASRTNNLNQFELIFPLCSGDSLDFCLHPGDTTGFRMEYLDAQANGDFGGTMFYPNTGGTSEAQIKIGTCSASEESISTFLPLIHR
jgi:hypothetical protein